MNETTETKFADSIFADAEAYASELVDIVHTYIEFDSLSVKEWADVRRLLLEHLTASIEADKALGHDVG